jgi:glyoxylase-like metal-dependent hydrolase (beta-lactamase superfamily II)
VLVDFGFTGDTLNNNLDLIGINLAELDAMLLSHGHYDHFGGIEGNQPRLPDPDALHWDHVLRGGEAGTAGKGAVEFDGDEVYAWGMRGVARVTILSSSKGVGHHNFMQ